MPRQKRLGLSLRGGSAGTGSYIGVLKAFEENDIQVDMLVVSSGGGLVGSGFATGVPLNEIYERYKNFTKSKFIGVDSLRDKAIASNDKATTYWKEMIGDVDISETKKKMWVQVTNLDTMQSEYLDKGPLAESVMASSSLPLLFEPAELNGKMYVDGDFSSGYGAEVLHANGAEIVIGLNTKFDPHMEHTFLNNIVDPISIAIHRIRELDLAINPVDLLIDNIGTGVAPLDFAAGAESMHDAYEYTLTLMPEIKQILYA